MYRLYLVIFHYLIDYFLEIHWGQLLFSLRLRLLLLHMVEIEFLSFQGLGVATWLGDLKIENLALGLVVYWFYFFELELRFVSLRLRRQRGWV